MQNFMKTTNTGTKASPPQKYRCEAHHGPLMLEESATNGGVLPGDQERKGQRPGRSFIRSFATDIQKRLGARKPEVTAAFVLSTVLTWKPNPNHRPRGRRIHDARHLSAERIRKDLPWLSRSAVSQALKRLAKAYQKDFVLDFDKTKVSNIVVSNKLDKLHRQRKSTEGAISVDPTDAETHGVLQALLIRNLEWKCTHYSAPLCDEAGNVYGEMSPTALTEPRDVFSESPHDVGLKTVILPYTRQQVTGAISELVSKGLFVHHKLRPSFYRLQRSDTDKDQNSNEAFCDATVLSTDATRLSTDTTDVSMDTTNTSLKIEEGISEDRREVESDKTPFGVGPAALPPNVNKIELQSVEKGPTDPDTLSNAPRNEANGDASRNSLDSGYNPTRQYPLSIEDVMPGVLEEVDRCVRKYRDLRSKGQLITAVSNEELFYDVIEDPVAASWEELGLVIDYETEQPFDPNNTDEQIENFLEYFPGRSIERTCAFDLETDEDKAAIRGLFYKYPGLSDAILYEMLEHVGEADHKAPRKLRPRDGRTCFSDTYFSSRVKNAKQFARYFEQLFLETYAPVRDEDGHFTSDNGRLLRRWTALREDSEHFIPEPLDDDELELAEEPFRSIFQRDLAKSKALAGARQKEAAALELV